MKNQFHNDSDHKDSDHKDSESKNSFKKNQDHFSHLPVLFKDNFITITHKLPGEKEELKKKLKENKKQAKRARAKSGYYRTLLKTSLTHEDAEIKKYAEQIIDSYKKCKDLVKIKIIHSIIANIDMFKEVSGSKGLEMTSEKLLGWIFAIDEKIGNAHISFLNDNENIRFLSLQLTISVNEIIDFREKGIYFTGDFSSTLTKDKREEIEKVISENVSAISVLIAGTINKGTGHYYLSVMPGEIKHEIDRQIDENPQKKEQYYSDPYACIENVIDVLVKQGKKRDVLENSIYTNIQEKEEIKKEFIQGLKKKLTREYEWLSCEYNEPDGCDLFHFIHELFDNEAGYKGEVYGDYNIGLRLKNRLEAKLHLIRTQLYIKVEPVIRKMHPFEVVEARFRLYFEKSGIIPIYFTGSGEFNVSCVKKELEARKAKGYIIKPDNEHGALLKIRLAELLDELYGKRFGTKNIAELNKVILDIIKDRIKRIDIMLVKKGYFECVRYTHDDDYDFFLSDDDCLYMTKYCYDGIFHHNKDKGRGKKSRQLLAAIIAHIIENAHIPDTGSVNQLLLYLNRNFNIAKNIKYNHLRLRKVVSRLLHILVAHDKYVFRTVVRVLGKIGHYDAAEPLAGELKDGDKKVNEYIIPALIYIGGEKAVDALIRRLGDYFYKEEVVILGKIGGEYAEDLLLPKLNHAKAAVRSAAAEILGEIRSTKAIHALIHRLHDSSSIVRTQAAIALGKIGDKKAVQELIKCLFDKNEFVRQGAAEALGNIGDRRAVHFLKDRLNDTDENIRKAVVRALGMLGDENVVNEVVHSLKDKSSSVRTQAVLALAAIGNTKAVNALIKGLNNKNKDIRLLVVRAFSEVKNSKVVDALIQKLYDEDLDICLHAIDALGRTGTATAVDILMKRLDQINTSVPEIVSSSNTMVIRIIKALGDTGNTKAVDALVHGLRTSDANVRIEIAGVLGRIGGMKAIDALIQTVDDRDKYVCIAAINALGRIGHCKATAALIGKLESLDPDVHDSVLSALDKIKHTSYMDSLVHGLSHERRSVRKLSAEALGVIKHPGAVDALMQRLADTDTSVRRAAVLALGKIGDTGTVDALIRLLDDKESSVRGAVIAALGEIGDSRAVPVLIKRLRDEKDYICRAAADALGEIGDTHAIDALVESFDDRDDAVRKAAISAVGNILGLKYELIEYFSGFFLSTVL